MGMTELEALNVLRQMTVVTNVKQKQLRNEAYECIFEALLKLRKLDQIFELSGE